MLLTEMEVKKMDRFEQKTSSASIVGLRCWWVVQIETSTVVENMELNLRK